MTGDELLAAIVKKHFPHLGKVVVSPLTAATINNALRLELGARLDLGNVPWADILAEVDALKGRN